jgi:hypothetical protein
MILIWVFVNFTDIIILESRYVSVYFFLPLYNHFIFQIVKTAWMQFNAIQLNWHLECFLEITFH